MAKSTIKVVGNKFKNIANGESIVIYNDFIDKLANNSIQDDVMFEQGVNEREVIVAEEMADNINLNSYFDKTVRCPKNLTHKSKEYNTLISEPVKAASGYEFNSYLLIDDDCAELSDHVTGKHIQFMVLVEAARQMVNAVTEKYLSNSKMIFLASDLNLKFFKFVYPFETKMSYRVLESKMKAVGNGKMSVLIDFIQASEVRCSIKFDFTILERSFVSKIEDSGLKELTEENEVA